MAEKSEIMFINPKYLNNAQVCDLFGITRPTLTDWVKKGCPIYKDTTAKGQPMVYDLGSVIRWRVEWLKGQHKTTSKDDLDTEKLKEQIKKLQLENADRERKTITKDRHEEIGRTRALELRGFWTDGYKRNAQLMMKNLGIQASKLVEFLEVMDAWVKEGMDKFVSSGEEIE